MKKILKEKKILIYKDTDGIYYYSMFNSKDTLITKMSNADDAFNFVQQKNNRK
jgi:hypothetical protein